MKNSQKKIISLSICTAFILQMNLAAADIKKSESLGSVDVTSTNVTENTGSYTIDNMGTSTKLYLSIRETPQSVSVFTTKKLQDLGISSYSDMLSYVTGITLNRWDERLKSSARGFTIDYYKVDGVPTYTTYNDRDIDLSIYDRVEVVRGANGLTTGSGNPGISINLVRKRANSKELTGSITADTGSWNKYGLTADVSFGLNEDGSVRGRIISKHEKSDSYMDTYDEETNLFYAAVDADISDTTYLSLGTSYQKTEKNGVRWGGLPAFDSNGNRIDFNRSMSVSEDWTYLESTTKSIFANLEQVLSKDISLNLAYSYDQIDSDTALLYFGGAWPNSGTVNTNDGSGLQYMDWESEKEKQEHNLDLNVNIPFELGGLSQEVVVGASYNISKQIQYEGYYPNDGSPLGAYDTPLTNFYDYDIPYTASSSTEVPYVIQPNEIIQKALYLAGNFSLTKDLKLIAGTRLSSWEHSSDDTNVETRKFNNEITPYFGLVYDLDENHSIYTSYTSIFNPQDDKDANGNYLDPIEGKSYEAGVKGEYFDGTLNTSVSIFRIEQDGVAALSGKQIANPGLDAYIASEGVTSKGFEIDLAGQITDNLSIDLGVANFKAEDAFGTKFDTLSSRTTANLFAKYIIDDFTIGAGLQYKSKFYTTATVGGASKMITQDSYTTANAMLGYRINKNANIQLNVDNIFDKEYYDGIGGNGMVYGDPRNFTLSLKYSF